MRIVIGALLAFMVAAVWSGPVKAAASADDLAASILTASDLGDGYTEIQSGNLSTLGMPMYMSTFVRADRGTAAEVVVDVLVDTYDDSRISTEDFAAGFVRGFGAAGASGLTLQRTDAPAIGENAAMWTVSGVIQGQQMSGDIIAWRHGTVVAAVLSLGTSAATALPHAYTQEDKLTGVIG